MSDEDITMEPSTKRQKLETYSGDGPSTSENHTKNEYEYNNENNDFTSDNFDGTSNGGFGLSHNKYDDYVTPEELEKLKEFQVLDEVKSNNEDSGDENSDSSDDKSEGIPEDEIEKMLEENLPDDFKGAPKPKEKSYVTRQKIVLEEKGINQFEVLPLDWMMVRHHSGMPVYIHRPSRVATLSKPYFLGKGNARRHDVPISAIPCLAYRKALEEEAKQQEIDKIIAEQIKTGSWKNQVNNNIKKDNISNENSSEIKCPYNSQNSHVDNLDKENEANTNDNSKSEIVTKDNEVAEDNKEINENMRTNNLDVDENVDDVVTSTSTNGNNLNTSEDIEALAKPVILPGGIVMAPPKVETVNTSWKTQNLSHEKVNEYCKKLFKFKTVNVMHFKRWADRRKYNKARKTFQYPTLPEGTKLITIPAQNDATAGAGAGGKSGKRDWAMNMNGRSYLSVFHEYVRRALHKQPVYEFKQLENAATPYQAVVYIGGMQYGVGRGSSKRLAKAAAARHSIQILIPGVTHLDEPESENADLSFFDYVGIEDPRISELCAATCEPAPHAVLRTCLTRNFGAGDRHIHTEMKKLEYQKIELTMKVGKHTATVVCKNKKTAKQRASQAILQALHPHVKSWGSLLRLYGSRSIKSCKEKKQEEQQITLLQDKARHNEPNYAVLEKLRLEMRRLRERDEAIVPIRTLLVKDDLPTHSGSNLNNVDL